MNVDEFSLIDLIIKESKDAISHSRISVGPGDDAGVISIPNGQELAVTTDVLLEGTHFPEGSRPELIGYRSMAASLSDLAAMGAEPFFHTVSLTMEHGDPDWLKRFAQGISFASQEFNSVLLGGNLSKGSLSIAITANGLIPNGMALRRSGAKNGDDVWVTGAIGVTHAFLEQKPDDSEESLVSLRPSRNQSTFVRYFMPSPRLEFGMALRSLATAAIDLSDGLIAEMRHILHNSLCGATIHIDLVPTWHGVKPENAIGPNDSYELLFTASEDVRTQVFELGQKLNVNVTRIGRIVEGSDLRCYSGAKELDLVSGYSHF